MGPPKTGLDSPFRSNPIDLGFDPCLGRSARLEVPNCSVLCLSSVLFCCAAAAQEAASKLCFFAVAWCEAW